MMKGVEIDRKKTNPWFPQDRFGLFLTYYVEHLGKSQSTISWIGALQMFLLNFVGFFSGRFVDLGYLRASLLAGCALQVLGAFATAFATRYWHLLLAQGVCSGAGHGLLFAPVVSLLPTYFRRHRALAVALATCGAATGGMVFPAIAYVALPRYGFRWAVLIMACVIAFNAVVILALTRARVAVRKPRSLFDLRAFKELWYSLFAAGSFLTLWGVYFAYFYVSSSPT